MSATLTGLIERVKTLLMDSGSLVWDTATLGEAVRQALGEYNLAGESAATISGLDGAGSTTLPAAHDSLLVLGASGYAALARCANRAESYALGGETGQLQSWGQARLGEFRAMLRFLHPEYGGMSGGQDGGEDPAKTAAQIALLQAQAGRSDAEAARVMAETGRSAAVAAHIEAQTAHLDAKTAQITAQTAIKQSETASAAAAITAEAERLRDLRASEHSPWGHWQDPFMPDQESRES